MPETLKEVEKHMEQNGATSPEEAMEAVEIKIQFGLSSQLSTRSLASWLKNDDRFGRVTDSTPCRYFLDNNSEEAEEDEPPALLGDIEERMEEAGITTQRNALEAAEIKTQFDFPSHLQITELKEWLKQDTRFMTVLGPNCAPSFFLYRPDEETEALDTDRFDGVFEDNPCICCGDPECEPERCRELKVWAEA